MACSIICDLGKSLSPPTLALDCIPHVKNNSCFLTWKDNSHSESNRFADTNLAPKVRLSPEHRMNSARFWVAVSCKEEEPSPCVPVSHVGWVKKQLDPRLLVLQFCNYLGRGKEERVRSLHGIQEEKLIPGELMELPTSINSLGEKLQTDCFIEAKYFRIP